jgi:hypothetical protein
MRCAFCLREYSQSNLTSVMGTLKCVKCSEKDKLNIKRLFWGVAIFLILGCLFLFFVSFT